MNFLDWSNFINLNIHRFPEFFEKYKDQKFDPIQSEERLINCLSLEKIFAEKNIKKALRQWRNQELLLIAYRDLSQKQKVLETCSQLSYIAEICIKNTLKFLQEAEPVFHDLDIDVLAMGKLGGGELNFSSDIDLIFVLFEPNPDEKILSAALNLMRKFINLLDQNTEDGFVYRVDMRLRPFGQQGALVISEKQLIEYYRTQGRDWERYALMKSRFLIKKRENCEKAINDFVYQGSPDYSMRQAMIKLYRAIQKEQKEQACSRNSGFNIKLGEGGIREAEFIVQALQIMHSAQEKRLRYRGFCQALTALVSERYLSNHQGLVLEEAYLFLRDLENKLQMESDRQTHIYPRKENLETLKKLAFVMGFENFNLLDHQLNQHRQAIMRLRINLMDTDIPDLIKPVFIPKPMDYFESIRPEGDLCKNLLNLLKQPALETIHRHPDPKLAKEVLLDLFKSIANKKSYLSLLASNIRQLDRLLILMTQSVFLKDLVIQYPRVLPLFWIQDESEPRSMGDLKQIFSQTLSSLENLESQLNYLKEQKIFQICRIAISDLENRYPIMRISDFLSELAEVLVESACDLSWRELVERYGFPKGIYYGKDYGFSVIAYGKLGGLELGYGSDLDLVFLYQNKEEEIFYTRFAQKLVQCLQSKTEYGDLYPIDNRLRPSGGSGLLATAIETFSKYQRESAWTWEHQALLRARPIFSNLDLHAHFEQIRLDVLCRPREAKKLAREVRQMREKMRQHLWKKSSKNLDLKQVPGGVIDIEFLVQYLALLHAHHAPILVRYTDNIRILEALAEEKIIPKPKSERLMEIYRQYRNCLHRYTLTRQENLLNLNVFIEERRWVFSEYETFIKI